MRAPRRSLSLAFCLAAAVTLGSVTEASASTITFGAGSAVTTADFSATFDSLTSNGLSLAAYSEGGLSITVPDATFIGFSAFTPGGSQTTAFHYGSGGNRDFVTIKGTSGQVFSGIEFQVGDGNLGTTTNIRWQTFLAGTPGSTGQSVVTRGSIVGFLDPAGFDELRVIGRDPNIDSDLNFGDLQAIALDNVRAQQLVATPVPEPATLSLLGFGLAGVAYRRFRKRT